MATNSSSNASDALREDLKSLREDVGHLAATLKEMTDDGKSETLKSVRNGAKVARQKVHETSEAASQVVVKRPLVSVLVVFALGMLLGTAFGRRA